MEEKKNTPEVIYVQENDTSMRYGVNQDENVKGMVKYIREDKVSPLIDNDIRVIIRRMSEKQYINLATVLKIIDSEMDVCNHFLKHKESDYSRGRYEGLEYLRSRLIFKANKETEFID